MANRLNGKIAIVTGAGSGLGKAVALEYLRENCKIVAIDNKGDRLDALQKEAEGLSLAANIIIYTGDIISNKDCDNAVAAAVEAFGPLNVLAHFAGVMDYRLYPNKRVIFPHRNKFKLCQVSQARIP